MVRKINKKTEKCPQCNEPMYQGSTLCKRCSSMGINNPFCNKTHTNKIKKLLHQLKYKHGGKHKCIDCNVDCDIRGKRCQSCSTKKSHKDNIFDYHRRPTKPESIVTSLLPKSFKYVGNNKLSIGSYNPDFINKKDKKIIEVFGDYWHNIPQNKKRDKEKINIYYKLGYKVLIIWEKEIKNITILNRKINNFIRNKG